MYVHESKITNNVLINIVIYMHRGNIGHKTAIILLDPKDAVHALHDQTMALLVLGEIVIWPAKYVHHFGFRVEFNFSNSL